MNEDVRLVLAEITRVQKALQVDYLPPTKGMRSGAMLRLRWKEMDEKWFENMRQDMEKLQFTIVI